MDVRVLRTHQKPLHGQSEIHVIYQQANEQTHLKSMIDR